jgi:SOS-response transcriptional repressor LexA
MNRTADDSQPVFTPRQGQYLAFIHTYTLVNGRPPAEADMMWLFRVTPPTIHQMVLALEQAGLISRQPGMPRSIAVLLDRSALPELYPGHVQPVKITVTRYYFCWKHRKKGLLFEKRSKSFFPIWVTRFRPLGAGSTADETIE